MLVLACDELRLGLQPILPQQPQGLQRGYPIEIQDQDLPHRKSPESQLASSLQVHIVSIHDKVLPRKLIPKAQDQVYCKQQKSLFELSRRFHFPSKPFSWIESGPIFSHPQQQIVGSQENLTPLLRKSARSAGKNFSRYAGENFSRSAGENIYVICGKFYCIFAS